MPIITRCEPTLLRLPLPRPVWFGSPARWADALFVLLVRVATEGGPEGLGFVVTFRAARALAALVADDIAPRVLGLEALTPGPLLEAVRSELGHGHGGLTASALSAIDLALWDVKGKVAGLPVWRLWPGGSPDVLTFAIGVAGPASRPEEVAAALRPYRERGVRGAEVSIGGDSLEDDVHRLEHVRSAVGDEVWLAVRAEAAYDLRSALSMARYVEEEVGVDWFEGLLPADDVEGHARLAAHLEVALAVGGDLAEVSGFRRFVDAKAAGVLRPEPRLLGGVTPFLTVAAFARMVNRPIVPTIAPQIGAHLAAGVPGLHSVPYTDSLAPLFGDLPLANGRLLPPERPGWGLELQPGVVERFRA